MTYKELVIALAKRTGCTQVAVKSVLEALSEEIQAELAKKEGGLAKKERGLAKNEGVWLSGLGRFSARHRKARVGRHPQTGEQIRILPRWVPVFTPTTAFREALNAKPHPPNKKSR